MNQLLLEKKLRIFVAMPHSLSEIKKAGPKANPYKDFHRAAHCIREPPSATRCIFRQLNTYPVLNGRYIDL